MAKIRVTAVDLESGEEETQEIENDYVLTVAGSCYVSHITSFPTTGTHVITIRREGWRRRAAAAKRGS